MSFYVVESKFMRCEMEIDGYLMDTVELHKSPLNIEPKNPPHCRVVSLW